MPIHSVFLKYFDEVCRSGSVRLAARKLHVASSAVNRQILKVEDELGVKLFDRSHDGMTLTPAGELLSQHVRQTLAEAQRTLEEIATVGAGSARAITIAGQESVIGRFLPPVLVEFHAEFPEVCTAFKAAGGEQLNELLQLGSADVALAFDPAAVTRVTQIATQELAVGAVVSSRHPIAAREAVSLADCAPYPVVLPDQSWPLRAVLDTLIAASDVQLNIATWSNSVEFLRLMLDQELGIGFQTVVGIEDKVDRGELVLVPLRDPDPVRQVFAICARDDLVLSPPPRRLFELLEARLKEYASSPPAVS